MSWNDYKRGAQIYCGLHHEPLDDDNRCVLCAPTQKEQPMTEQNEIQENEPPTASAQGDGDPTPVTTDEQDPPAEEIKPETLENA